MDSKVMKLRACDAAAATKLMLNSKQKQKQKLPDDIIFNILSFLPLRSLYKFKCVCKLWNTLSLHPFFLYLYLVHTLDFDKDFDFLVSLDKTNYSRDVWLFATLCQSSHQLVVQRTCTRQPTYRILSCPLRDVFPIPPPQFPSLCITLEFLPSSNNISAPDGAVKLISAHQQDAGKTLCYELLSLRIGHLNTASTWRPINIPSSERHCDGRKRNNIQLFFRMGFAYCIWFVDDDLDIQVDVLDMVNETYIGHTTFPRAALFSNSNMNMTTTLHLLDWNGLLSFSQLLNDDELHVLVLDNPTKLKWAETKHVIKLKFLAEDHNNKQRRITFHACAEKSFLLFLWHDDHQRNKKFLYKYDINTEELCASKPEFILSGTMTDAEFVALTVARIPFFKARCMILK